MLDESLVREVLGAALSSGGRLAEIFAEEKRSTQIRLDDRRVEDSGPPASRGRPTGRTALIELGVLRGFLHNAITARRDRTESTGNASRPSFRGVPGISPSNLVVEPGDHSLEDILRRAGRAVYVQDVKGVHSGANPVSGEFSVGTSGLRVEDGSLGEPLREMTIAGTLPDVPTRIDAVGADPRFFPGAGAIGTPAILVTEMTGPGV